MSRRIALVLALGLALAAFAAPQARSQTANFGQFSSSNSLLRAATRFALVVGVDAVGSGSAAKDATKVAMGLGRAGFLVELMVPEGTLPPRGGTVVLERLQRLAALAGPLDTLLFYFAGNGAPDRMSAVQSGVLIGADRLDLEAVHSALKGSTARHKLLVVDAPRPASRAGTDWSLFTRYRGVSCVFATSNPRQRSHEEGGGGIFTRLFLEGLSGKADFKRDGYISFRECAYYIQRGLARWSFRSGELQRATFVWEDHPSADAPLRGASTARPNDVVIAGLPGAARGAGARGEAHEPEPVAPAGVARRTAGARRGDKASARAVADGLRWLMSHQDDDGRWDCDEFGKHCPSAERCTGPGGSLYDVGSTGLALLAFLGDGHHPARSSPYQRTVQRGLKWLLDEMEEGEDDGLIGGRHGHAFLYNHGVATLALCEAYALSKQPDLRLPAQRALNFIQRARNPYKAWRYDVPPSGENDTSMTAWMVLALKAGQEAGLEVGKQAFDGALVWLDEVTDPATGRCGYTRRGEPPARMQGLQERYPVSVSESLTAAALLCRILMGATPQRDPILLQHADLLLFKPPRWSQDGSSNDYYYWHYGTFAMFQMGGKYWKAWNGAIKAALLNNQDRRGHQKGSWDPIGPWGKEGGRVYATALCTLCLEAHGRSAKLSGGGPEKR